MKEWKIEFANKIAEAAKDNKIVSVRDVALANGIKQIPRHDLEDIMTAISAAVPNYHPVYMFDSKDDNGSLFCTLCYVQNDVEFDDGFEFGEVDS